MREQLNRRYAPRVAPYIILNVSSVLVHEPLGPKPFGRYFQKYNAGPIRRQLSNRPMDSISD